MTKKQSNPAPPASRPKPPPAPPSKKMEEQLKEHHSVDGYGCIIYEHKCEEIIELQNRIKLLEDELETMALRIRADESARAGR